jgi:hypothetical protein
MVLEWFCRGVGFGTCKKKLKKMLDGVFGFGFVFRQRRRRRRRRMVLDFLKLFKSGW